MRNKANVVLLLMILLIVVIFSIIKGNTMTFCEFYGLTEDSTLSSASVIRIAEEEITEEEITGGEITRVYNERKIFTERFQPIYDYLLKLEVQKVDPQVTVELESAVTYSISFSVKNDDGYSSFSIEIGEFYILITPFDEGGEIMYKHNLTVDEYENKLINNLY
jgi:hypothetical protein